MFLPGYGLIAIADWSIIVQCHLLVKHGFSIYWCSRWNGRIEYIETTAPLLPGTRGDAPDSNLELEPCMLDMLTSFQYKTFRASMPQKLFSRSREVQIGQLCFLVFFNMDEPGGRHWLQNNLPAKWQWALNVEGPIFMPCHKSWTADFLDFIQTYW
jgi:hypothetical protein